MFPRYNSGHPQFLQGPSCLICPPYELIGVCHLRGTTALLSAALEDRKFLLRWEEMLLSPVTFEAFLRLPGSQLEQPELCQKAPVSCRNSSGRLSNPLPPASTRLCTKKRPQLDPLTTHFQDADDLEFLSAFTFP